MRKLFLRVVLFGAAAGVAMAGPPKTGTASWYGEKHRGKLMADGQPFDPDKLTAASWLYPLGTKVRVMAAASTNFVEVTITDRGPSRKFVRQGRIIDLSRAAFDQLTTRDRGLINVTVHD
jgi:rare lipoprotein A